MRIFIQYLYTFFPLLLVTLGGLVSEYAGRMACFLDSIINLGAILCFTFTVLTHNVVLGFILSVIVSSLVVFIFEKISIKLQANIFLIALAMNILFTALCSLIAAKIFGSRGVLSSDYFVFVSEKSKLITTLVCSILSLLIIIMLKYSHTGLSIKITGSDAIVLDSKGISSSKYASLSWVIAAMSASVTGCTLAIRLSSYVPSMSAGRGWIALAAVFLGRKKPILIILVTAIFSATEFLGLYILNISLFKNIPNSILQSLPYLISLLMILFSPKQKKD